MLVVRGDELARRLEEIVTAREAVVAIAAGVVEGDAAAALMFSDWAVMEPGSALRINSPAAYAGAIWRLGAWTLGACWIGRSTRCGAWYDRCGADR